MAYDILFIDSDIILDIILQRKPHFQASADLLNICSSKKITGYTSVHSILNVHYLAKKIHGERLTRSAIEEITKIIAIISEDSTLIFKALTSDFSDFEDAVQYYAALSANAEVIITRNIKDYKNSVLPVFTAEQFLNSYPI